MWHRDSVTEPDIVWCLEHMFRISGVFLIVYLASWNIPFNTSTLTKVIIVFSRNTLTITQVIIVFSRAHSPPPPCLIQSKHCKIYLFTLIGLRVLFCNTTAIKTRLHSFSTLTWKSFAILVKLHRKFLGSGIGFEVGGRSLILWTRSEVKRKTSFLASSSPIQYRFPIPKGIKRSFLTYLDNSANDGQC